MSIPVMFFACDTTFIGPGANCTAGKNVLGGGHVVVAVSGNEAAVSVTANRPSDSDNWSVTGAEDIDVLVGIWSLQAFAPCVTAS